jgi:hypothetical protein
MTSTTPPLLLLRPDGARPLTERLSFLTSITTALDGTERRVALRAFPRRSYTSQFTFLNAEARAVRDMLRYADRVGFPLVQHELLRGASSADAGAAESGPLLVVNRDGSTAFAVQGADIGGYWLQAKYIAPYAEGWLDLSRQVTHRSAGVSSAVLAFEVDGLDEQVSPWGGAFDAGKPVWPYRADWSAAVSEAVNDEADTADFGHLRLRDVRYSKRTVDVSLLLIGRAAVLDFRRLMFTLRGALGAFRYQFEPDGVMKTWRLAGDDVDIEYLRPSLARVALRFMELSE